MTADIKLLDCTLRDGAYIVDGKFGEPAIRGIISKLNEAEVDVIECGWLKNPEYEMGTTYYHVPGDLCQYLGKKKKNTVYVVMIDWDRYDLDYLPEYDGSSIDAVRVVFPHGKHREGIEVAKGIKQKGYKVFLQAANTLAYSDEDLISLAQAVNELCPVSLSVVDTFGAMYSDDLERIVAILDERLDGMIGLGFHSHNNQQLSFALSMRFVELLENSGRQVIVDSSLCGMGRGAGNATTELVASYLNKKQNGKYDMNAIMDAIDIYMSYFQENFSWGYSTPYFIAGLYCCHVNNIAYLLKNHRCNAMDMRNVIESLDPADRKKYDYDLLERKYIENQSKHVDDKDTIEKLKSSLTGREILLLAPGRSVIQEEERIKAYIDEKKPVVVGVNAIVGDYAYDYMYFTNSVRYDYAGEAHGEKFAETKKILLSNIKTEGLENESVVNFDRVIKRGWQHFDNAVITCLRLMARLGCEDVAIAGFDGFKHRYNESYADAQLPTLNPENKWDELNEEIADMYRELRQSDGKAMRVKFITDSIFAMDGEYDD